MNTGLPFLPPQCVEGAARDGAPSAAVAGAFNDPHGTGRPRIRIVFSRLHPRPQEAQLKIGSLELSRLNLHKTLHLISKGGNLLYCTTKGA